MLHLLLYIALGFVLFFFLLWIFMIAPSGRRRKTKLFFQKCRFLAHRGLYGDEIPENSLPAFERACRARYGIELDVHLTADKELAVFHDDSLKRMCGVEKDIEQMTMAQLTELRLNGTAETIPTLREVLDLVKGRATILIEEKGQTTDPEVCRRTAEVMKGYEGAWCVESFNPFHIRWWRKNERKVIRGILSCRMPKDEFLKDGKKNFLLQNMLLNVIARPDFLAYGIDSRRLLSFRMAKLLGGYAVGWTAKTKEDFSHAKKVFGTVIFEQLQLNGRDETL